jgi:ribose 5-phosphate isomerase
VIHGDFSDSGQEKVMQHVNQQGVYGVGADGTIYRFVQTLNFNQEASDGSANTTTIETTLNYISQGDTPNTSFHVVLHTTFNANGEPTSNVYNYHVDCELPE